MPKTTKDKACAIDEKRKAFRKNRSRAMQARLRTNKLRRRAMNARRTPPRSSKTKKVKQYAQQPSLDLIKEVSSEDGITNTNSNSSEGLSARRAAVLNMQTYARRKQAQRKTLQWIFQN